MRSYASARSGTGCRRKPQYNQRGVHPDDPRHIRPLTSAAPALLAADDSGTKGDSITNVRQPHLVGNATAGSLVQVINVSNSVLGFANAAADGSYSVLVASPLSDGSYALRVQVQDVAGNLSAPSLAFNLTIDVTLPATPAAPALLAADDSGITGDGITNVRQPHLVGNATAGTLVQVINVSNSMLGSATAAADGSYSVPIASPLSDGTLALRVQAQDVAGNLSAASTVLNLTIDATPPATPAAPTLDCCR